MRLEISCIALLVACLLVPQLAWAENEGLPKLDEASPGTRAEMWL